ncbi:MAG: hypothetical protein ACT6UH_00800 [Hydrogenophaga sp.]|uniref:hypothetical protein n=1 Tax=Hydrogenophaga sp. TaxID=1904254 RepID=UPI0040367FC3
MPLLSDITIDTNVLMHACNPKEARCIDALNFLNALIAASTKLAVDQGFSLDSSKNSSKIGHEYLARLSPQSFAAQVVATMAASKRISLIEVNFSAADKRKLNQILSNKRDRTFVLVCAASEGKSFVSHDFGDFPEKKRRELQGHFGVSIVECCQTTGFFS